MASIDHTWYRRPANAVPQISAGGVVARQYEGRVLIALVREGLRGAWVLPKGRQEHGETLEQAARREIEEEAGLSRLTLLDKLAVLERYDYPKTRWKVVHYYLFVTTQETGIPTDRTRHYDTSWFAIDALPHMFWPEQKALIETRRDHVKRLVLALNGLPPA